MPDRPLTKPPVRVIFVCWGNICRSPMAERVARHAAEDEGLFGVEFSSAATSAEELDAPIDPRAARTLTRHGYDAAGHAAHRITADELANADLVVAMEDLHVDRLRTLADSAAPDQFAPGEYGLDKVVLLSTFDPQAEPGSGVPDPWYGAEDGFADTLAMIESAMPGVLQRVRELQSDLAG